MRDLNPIANACGVIVGRDEQGRFAHLATAWSVGPGEWVSSWTAEEPPAEALLLPAGGAGPAPIRDWEMDGGLAGFASADVGPGLPVHRGATLHKRDPLWALGYPDLIEHPSFQLHRGSLDPQRYFPYLCPWTISGHLTVFTAADGWLTGRLYPGMGGGPVLDRDGQVVGVLLDGAPSPNHPPLTRFHRLD